MTQTGHKAEMPQGCGGLTRKKTPLFRFLKPDPEIQMKAFYCSFWQQQQPKKPSCAFLCGWIIHRVFIYLFIFSISSLFDKLPKPRGLAEPSCRAERLDALFWRVLVSCSPDSFVSDKCIWLGTGQPLHLHSTADEGWSERHQTQICMFCVQTECTHGSVPSSHWRPRLSEFDSDLLDAAQGAEWHQRRRLFSKMTYKAMMLPLMVHFQCTFGLFGSAHPVIHCERSTFTVCGRVQIHKCLGSSASPPLGVLLMRTASPDSLHWLSI